MWRTATPVRQSAASGRAICIDREVAKIRRYRRADDRRRCTAAVVCPDWLYFLKTVKTVPGCRKKSVALAQIVALTGDPSYCFVPGSVAEMTPDTLAFTG